MVSLAVNFPLSDNKYLFITKEQREGQGLLGSGAAPELHMEGIYSSLSHCTF